MATTSLSRTSIFSQPREVERELKFAQSKLHDAIFDEDEEAIAALKRQVLRLEMLKELNERYDTDF